MKLRGIAVVSLAVLSLAGCNKEPKATAEPSSPAPAEQPAAPKAAAPTELTAAALTAPAADPAAPAAASKLSEANFELSMVPSGAYKVGQPGEVTVVLEAKGGFKVNDKYPYKFKLKETPGVKFASQVVGKDAVKLEPKRATLPVAFTPESGGKHTIGGQLSFSVCTDDKCLIEKRELALDIQAD